MRSAWVVRASPGVWINPMVPLVLTPRRFALLPCLSRPLTDATLATHTPQRKHALQGPVFLRRSTPPKPIRSALWPGLRVRTTESRRLA